jgi:hypothetical protein
MSNTIVKFNKSAVYTKFYDFCKAKYNYPSGIFNDKSFTVILGFLIDFSYNQGYEVIASHRGFKITQHKKGNLLTIDGGVSDSYNYTIYMKQNDATTLNNYEQAFNILFRALNKSYEPF